jgi:outer membrane receptor protein involved in Fe transport
MRIKAKHSGGVQALKVMKTNVKTIAKSRSAYIHQFSRSVTLMFALFLAFGLAPCIITAQTSSGTISGRVVDATGGVVLDADVRLINELTGNVVTAKVQSDGGFVFPDVQPGTYTVDIRANGYKELLKKGLALSSSERLSAGTLTLQVGSVSQSVTVSAATTPVQTQSAEVSGLLDTKQLDNLLAVGRDFMSMVRTIPGVVGGGAGSLGTSGTPTINGIRNVNNSGTIDGVSGSPRGGDKIDTPPNLDAIQEVKVLTSNYQAEYGAGTAGPVINLVTKSGTQNFHGTAYYYVRNEAFNANDWFNNYNDVPRPQYRYNTVGGNIGGPIYWPGHFNTARNKLFFFYSQEYWPDKSPEGLKKYMVPTALERAGDFSQTPSQGKVNPDPNKDYINIKKPGADPSTCPATGTGGNHSGCYPGNKLPAGAINAQLQALLNVLPMPNFDNRVISGGNYNYLTNYTGNNPVNQEIFRIDYNATDKMHMFFRGEFMTVNDDAYSSPANKLPWLLRVNYQTTHPNLAYDMTYAFSPTLLNEITVGTSGFGETQLYNKEDLVKATKSSSGYNVGQLYPQNNPMNLYPAVSFGGVSNAAAFGWDSRFPMYDRTRQYSLTDSLTKVLGPHNLKFGINLATDHYLQAHSSSGTPEGSFDYGKNVNNPNDSNYAYANALQGLFNSYSEPTARSDYNPRIYIIEWYGQDQWRVTPRLTLDYGMRFAWVKPPTLQTGGNFVPSLFDPAQAPILYQPKKANGKTVAVDPTTGQTYPGAYVGLFVPNTGNLANGAITTKSKGYPEGLVYGTGVQLGPRFGFAYDPKGNGKTAIRGGFGVFINPATQIGQEGDMTHNPPAEFVPQQYYGDINGFLNAGTVLGPPNFGASFVLHPQEMKVYSTSLGVQQDIGFGTVFSLGYVGNVARHLTGQQNINEVPYGAHFLPQNQSPAGGVLPDNFFRPYPGYGTITYRTTGLTSNYHSLQAQVTRRFKNGLEFGLAYTWSRAMDFTDSYDGSVATYQNLRVWNYGPAGWDRRNNLVVNYLWSLPKGSSLWSNFATRAILDNWQISGIASYISGGPAGASNGSSQGITFSTQDNVDTTGGGDGARVYLTGDPMRSAKHTFNQWFDTSVVHRPSQSTYDKATGVLTLSNGVSPFHPVYNPGFTNFDTALFKNIPVKERLALQLRLETYNTFNHPEFDGVNSAAKFAADGTETDPTFGQINDSNGPRVMQLAVRINF